MHLLLHQPGAALATPRPGDVSCWLLANFEILGDYLLNGRKHTAIGKEDRKAPTGHQFTFRHQRSDKRDTSCYAPMLTVPSVSVQPPIRTTTRQKRLLQSQPYLRGSCGATPRCSKLVSLAAAHSPCNPYSPHHLKSWMPSSFTIRCRLLAVQQNAPRRTSWVMSWKARQCNFGCCLHKYVDTDTQPSTLTSFC